jgi:hypothetical protein
MKTQNNRIKTCVFCIICQRFRQENNTKYAIAKIWRKLLNINEIIYAYFVLLWRLFFGGNLRIFKSCTQSSEPLQ